MKGSVFGLALSAGLLFASLANAQEATIQPAPVSPQIARTVEQLRTAALRDDNGYRIVESLVTRIGPRRAGSPEEARARDWAVAMLREQGFANIRVEPFTLRSWDATQESAMIVAPVQQSMAVAAIGGSPSTPPGGLEAEVVRFLNLEALAAAPAESVRGRMVFIDEPMARSQDASGYGAAVRKRSRCAPTAQAKGAVACLIRSVGTNTNRFPHQGSGPRQPDGASLPVGALSPPDSDVLARLLATGPVRVRLNITAVTQEAAPSGNVLAEIRGRERPEEIVLVAAHLDSWDLGQGAIDDGAGVGIIVAAARLIKDLPRRPRRTIRIFLAGSEETGGNGGAAYRDAHRSETHIIAGESDLGADLVWRARTRFGEGAMPYARAMQAALAPLAIIQGDNEADAGTDIDPMQELGVPIIGLNQDASRYFDYHHTADDTLDKVDVNRLRQNIAAWTTVLYLAAETDWDFRATAR